jgi:hypothetical protein
MATASGSESSLGRDGRDLHLSLRDLYAAIAVHVDKRKRFDSADGPSRSFIKKNLGESTFAAQAYP